MYDFLFFYFILCRSFFFYFHLYLVVFLTCVASTEYEEHTQNGSLAEVQNEIECDYWIQIVYIHANSFLNIWTSTIFAEAAQQRTFCSVSHIHHDTWAHAASFWCIIHRCIVHSFARHVNVYCVCIGCSSHIGRVRKYSGYKAIFTNSLTIFFWYRFSNQNCFIHAKLIEVWWLWLLPSD